MPPNIEVCDDDLNDQIELFNLDSQTSTILGTQNPADFSVSYHETAADADSGNNALVSPFQNITNPDEIFIRVTPTAVNNSCYVFSSTPFNLIVNSQPQVTAIPDYGICDVDNFDVWRIRRCDFFRLHTFGCPENFGECIGRCDQFFSVFAVKVLLHSRPG